MAEKRKFLDLTRLQEYDALIKAEIADGDSGVLTEAKGYADSIKTSITDGTVTVAEATHADSADTATSATSATKATQDASGNVITDTYETKTDAATKLAEAKTYADSIKDDLLNGAGAAYDTLKELGDLIDDNADAINALEQIASGKADASHTHTVSDISDLTATATELNYMDGVTSNVQSQLDGKATSDHTHSDYAAASHTHDNYASTVETSGDGNAITSITQNGNTIVATKGSTFLTAHPTITVGDDSTSTATPAFGGTFTAIDSVTRDSNGHVTKVNTKTVTVPSATATESANGLMTAAMVTKLNNIEEGATAITVDSALSDTSTNPVQNKVINSAIGSLTTSISNNTDSISSHTQSIAALQTDLAEFEEITSAEISALFA